MAHGPDQVQLFEGRDIFIQFALNVPESLNSEQKNPWLSKS